MIQPIQTTDQNTRGYFASKMLYAQRCKDGLELRYSRRRPVVTDPGDISSIWDELRQVEGWVEAGDCLVNARQVQFYDVEGDNVILRFSDTNLERNKADVADWLFPGAKEPVAVAAIDAPVPTEREQRKKGEKYPTPESAWQDIVEESGLPDDAERTEVHSSSFWRWDVAVSAYPAEE